MITEVAFFSVNRDDRDNERRVISALYAVPKGSRVILFLGDRRNPPYELLDHIVRDYIFDLAFEMQGEPYATQAAHDLVQEFRARPRAS